MANIVLVQKCHIGRMCGRMEVNMCVCMEVRMLYASMQVNICIYLGSMYVW